MTDPRTTTRRLLLDGALVVNSGVSLGYAVATARAERGSGARYALARAIALAGASAAVTLTRPVGPAGAIGVTLTVVQLLDAVIGAGQRDVAKTAGPAAFAVLTAAATVSALRR